MNSRISSKEKRRRSFKLQVYLTEIEKERLLLHMRNSGHHSLSSFARKRLVSTRPPALISKESIQALNAVGTELARSGNNLNQLTRYVHQGKKAGWFNPKVLAQFNALMLRHTQLQDQLHQVIKQILHRS